MKIEITGRVDEVKAEEPAGTTTKQDLWITEEPDGKYPKPHVFTFWKDKARCLDNLRPGDTVTVTAYTGANERNGKRWPSYTGASVAINAGANARPQTPIDEGAAVGAGGGAKQEDDSQDALPF